MNDKELNRLRRDMFKSLEPMLRDFSKWAAERREAGDTQQQIEATLAIVAKTHPFADEAERDLLMNALKEAARVPFPAPRSGRR